MRAAAQFLSLLGENEELAQQVRHASKPEVIALAQQNGCDMTEAEFTQVVQKVTILADKRKAGCSEDELSDDELEMVVGGCLLILGTIGISWLIKKFS